MRHATPGYGHRQFRAGSITHLEVLRRRIEEVERLRLTALDRDILSGVLRQAILLRRSASARPAGDPGALVPDGPGVPGPDERGALAPDERGALVPDERGALVPEDR